MVIKRNLFLFKTIRFVLEPLPEEIEKLKKIYLMINCLSYQELSLAGFEKRQKKTPLIDLTKTLPEIFFAFHDTTRNEIRRSEKNFDLKFVNDDGNFKEAYKLYCRHETSQKRIPESKNEFSGCKVFSAYFKDKMISTIICFTGSKYLRAKSISSLRMESFDKEMLRLISFSTRRLVWEICKYGKENDYFGFDLGSINLVDSNKASIAQFKNSFGGKIVDEYLYIYKSKIFKFFERVVKLKVLALKFLLKKTDNE